MFGLVFTGLASLEDCFSHSIPCYLTRFAFLVWCMQGWMSCWRGSPHWRITLAIALLAFNKIFMFGLAYAGLDELLEGVASAEDYLCQCTPCCLTRSTVHVWFGVYRAGRAAGRGRLGRRIISASALLVI
jgi:hypothetical protein